MNKNKTVAYTLAATLLVGGTFLGTKALFTDKVDTVGELSISTGDVDIKVLDSSQWKLNRNGAEYKDGTTVQSDESDNDGELPEVSGGNDNFNTDKPLANNLKPGDVLTKEVTIQNVGTLMASLNLEQDANKMNEQLDVLKGLIKAKQTDVKINDTDGNGLLSPEETATFTLTLEVSEESNSQHNATEGHNKDSIENVQVNLTDAWVLTATQQNK